MNENIDNLEGLTDTEYKNSSLGIHCRRCSTTTAEIFAVETLPRVLRQRPFGALIRNHRHIRIITLTES